jgi:hypothetical protein
MLDCGPSSYAPNLLSLLLHRLSEHGPVADRFSCRLIRDDIDVCGTALLFRDSLTFLASASLTADECDLRLDADSAAPFVDCVCSRQFGAASRPLLTIARRSLVCAHVLPDGSFLVWTPSSGTFVLRSASERPLLRAFLAPAALERQWADGRLSSSEYLLRLNAAHGLAFAAIPGRRRARALRRSGGAAFALELAPASVAAFARVLRRPRLPSASSS